PRRPDARNTTKIRRNAKARRSFFQSTGIFFEASRLRSRRVTSRPPRRPDARNTTKIRRNAKARRSFFQGTEISSSLRVLDHVVLLHATAKARRTKHREHPKN